VKDVAAAAAAFNNTPPLSFPELAPVFPSTYSLSLSLSLLVQLFSRKENRERKKETATGFSYGFFSVR